MNLKYIFSSLFCLSLIISCNKKENNNLNPENEFLFSLLQDWYLWNDQIDDTINPSSFDSPQSLLSQVRFSPIDKWSYIADAETFNSFYEEGTYLGYGFSYTHDDDNNIRFKFIYDESPFGKEGIERGWKLLEIDGVDVQTISDWSNAFGENSTGFTQNFLIENEIGTKTEYSISKDIVTINSVLHADTLTIANETIGYLVFNNFITPAKAELDDIFNEFESSNIQKLILDLRYNGGGSISVAEYLANYLIQADDNGKVLYKLFHNSNQTLNNKSYSLSKLGTLNIDELIVLSTESTASASELILNGLKPLMRVTHIGDGNTYGKPVGSYGWYNLDRTQVYSIISLGYSNSEDITDFFDGLEPKFTACDNMEKPFGDVNESMLAASIEYLETGTTDGCDVPIKWTSKKELPQEIPSPTLLLSE